MNTEAMLRLADALEMLEDNAFSMEDWWTPRPENICGAAACVAGWAVLTDPAEAERLRRYLECVKDIGNDLESVALNYPFSDRGRHSLGLTLQQADYLFTGPLQWGRWLSKLGIDDEIDCLDDITAKHAVIVLRGLATKLIKFPRGGQDERFVFSHCICPDCEARRGQ